MSRNITPYKNSSQGKKEQVTRMFDTISGNYDRLNRVISFGNDLRWRRKVVALTSARQPEAVLDVATGTGDLALALADTAARRIVGLDISAGMLDLGRKKVREQNLASRIEMVLGDSEQLPFAEGSFDVVTVGFGLRNFENLDTGLQEILRVLKPGGALVALETSVPSHWFWRMGYNFYCRYLMPAVGRMLSRDRAAYSYLSESAASFPHGEAFNNILKKIGFIGMEHKPQTFGVASIYVAEKPV